MIPIASTGTRHHYRPCILGSASSKSRPRSMAARLCRNFSLVGQPGRDGQRAYENRHANRCRCGLGLRQERRLPLYPIVTGTYYRHDYFQGVDINSHKNAPVPTPYMAAHSSNYDFIGAYDFSRQAGNLRVADHCISPGETWPWMGSTPYPATSESWQAVIRKGCPD